MVIIIKFPNGEAMSFTFAYANDLNKIVSALVANLDGRAFTTIEISINKLGPNLSNNS